MRLVLIPVLVLALLAHSAAGKLCGDDVDGADVPCACGDIVVSDTVLADDPVVEVVCEGNGLLLRAAGGARLNVDLSGKTLRGSGDGAGLMVVLGGEGGAHVTSSAGRATLVGFENGVVASSGRLGLLENVVVRDPVRDGIRVRSAGTVVRSCEVSGAGRDGFSFSGRRYLSVDNRSRGNQRHGYMLMGQGGDVRDCAALGNGTAGFMVTGSGHEIVDCVATGSGKNGIEVVASKLAIRGVRSEGNGAGGIEGHGAGWRLSGNLARGNGEHGIDARGSGMIDEGGNRGDGNGFALQGEAQQCRIGGVACAEASAE